MILNLARPLVTYPPAPFHLPLDIFLAGERGRPIDIDPIFGPEVEEIISDYRLETLQRGPVSPAASAVGFEFRTVETDTDHGIVLLSPSRQAVGLYVGCALAITPRYRGRGLGAELIFEFATTFGGLPTWFLDTPAYSPSGYKAHTRAWYLARNPEFLRAKGMAV